VFAAAPFRDLSADHPDLLGPASAQISQLRYFLFGDAVTEDRSNQTKILRPRFAVDRIDSDLERNGVVLIQLDVVGQVNEISHMEEDVAVALVGPEEAKTAFRKIASDSPCWHFAFSVLVVE
jgi:hypothetical protein